MIAWSAETSRGTAFQSLSWMPLQQEDAPESEDMTVEVEVDVYNR